MSEPDGTRGLGAQAAVQLWFTPQEWESLDEEEISSAAPLMLAFAVLHHAEAVVDVEAVTTAQYSHTSARVALREEVGVQLAHVRLGAWEGVRLVVFAVSLLAAELADLVPAGGAEVAHPGRHAAAYPLELFLAGLAAVPLQGPVLAHLSEMIAAEPIHASAPGGLTAEQAARQLTHLAQSCVGRLEAQVRSSHAVAPPLSWTLTTSGWFALVPAAHPAGGVVTVWPVCAADLAAVVAPALAAVLTAKPPTTR